MSTNVLIIAVVLMLLMEYSESLADDFERRHGRIKWHAAWRAARLAGPTVIVILFDWRAAAAGWGMRIGLRIVMKLVSARRATPRGPRDGA